MRKSELSKVWNTMNLGQKIAVIKLLKSDVNLDFYAYSSWEDLPGGMMDKLEACYDRGRRAKLEQAEL